MEDITANASSGKVRSLENELKLQLENLKTTVEGLTIKQAKRLFTSVNHQRKPEEYKQDRDFLLKTLSKVPSQRPICIDWMQNEVELKSCIDMEYSPESLAILLHQFFTDRIIYLVHLKHTLLVRWARVSSKPAVVSKMYDDFQAFMSFITLEYDDAVSRAKRLAKARTLVLAGQTSQSGLIDREDFEIYLKWLVSHFHTTKSLAATITLFKWLPHLNLDTILSNSKTKTFNEASMEDGPPKSQQAWTKNKATRTDSFQTSYLEADSSLLKGRHHGGGVRLRSDSLFGLGLVSRRMPEVVLDVNLLQPLFNHLLKIYSVGVEKGTSGDLELYYKSKQKFHNIFTLQEKRSTYLGYGMIGEDQDFISTSNKDPLKQKCYIKPATWTEFNTLKASKSFAHVKAYSQMRDSVGEPELLLGLQSKCLHMSSQNRALYALKQHVVMVTYHESVASVSSRMAKNALLIWKGIYQGLDARNPLDPPMDEDEGTTNELDINWDGMIRDTTSVFMTTIPGQEDTATVEGSVPIPTSHSRSQINLPHSTSQLTRDGSLTVPSAMKLMAQEDSRKISSKAHTVPKNSYFAFVLLRHLHIRDLMNRCQSVLNYFRSVERTLVINEGGLSLNSQGGASSSNYHSYSHLFETPADFRINQADFMKFKSVENHDDYYSCEDDIHVVYDSKGVKIVYEDALEDLKALEEELLIIGSYYILKCAKEKMSSKKIQKESVNIDEASLSKADRFELLHDLWSCEEQYLQAKKKAVDCYLEVYHLVPSPKERTQIAEVIYDIMTSRPDYSLEAEYFSSCYDEETAYWRAHLELVSKLFSKQLHEERDYKQLLGLVSTEGLPSGSFGMPHPLFARQPAALIGEESILGPAFLLEVCPSLSLAPQVYKALASATEEMLHLYDVACHSVNPETVGIGNKSKSKVDRRELVHPGSLAIRHKVLQAALLQVECLTQLGSTFNMDTRKHVFSDAYIENPTFVGDLCSSLLHEATSRPDMSLSEKQQKKADLWCGLAELLTARHRLLLSACETDVLLKIYKQQLELMELDPCHAHLRIVPFDHSAKLSISRDIDQIMASVIMGEREDASLDRYIPPESFLAIHELDIDRVGSFRFHSRKDVSELLSESGILNVKTALLVQVSAKQCLSGACQYHSSLLISAGRGHEASQPQGTFRKENLGSFELHQSSVFSSDSQYVSQDSKMQLPNTQKKKKSELFEKAFISLQNYKVPLRDLMLSQFAEKSGMAVRNKEEAVKAQRELLAAFCFNLNGLFANVSLKNQLILNYAHLQRILEGFPAIRDTCFLYGKPKDLTILQDGDTPELSFSLLDEPRQHRSRPPMVVSGDGKQLVNLWYIPHITEILTLLPKLLVSMTTYKSVLTNLVRCSLHLLHYCMFHSAYVQLAMVKRSAKLKADWGGLEGFGAELSTLANDMGRLEKPCDPQQICEFLEGKCSVLFWTLYVVVRWQLPQMFLIKDYREGYNVLIRQSSSILNNLTANPMFSWGFPSLNIPEPVGVLKEGTVRFPWRSLLENPLSGCQDVKWVSFHFDKDVFLTLGQLKKRHGSLAQGEIIGMNILFDEVLTCYYKYQKMMSSSEDRESHASGHLTSTDQSQPLSLSMAINKGLKLPAYVSPGASMKRGSCSNMSSSLRVSSLTSVKSGHHTPAASGWNLVPPITALDCILKYFKNLVAVETVKWVWSSRVLGSALPLERVKDISQLQLIKVKFEKEIAEPAMKIVPHLVAKETTSILGDMDYDSVTIVTDTPDGEMTASSDKYTPIHVLIAQNMRLKEQLEIQLLQEQIKHILKLQNFVILESEQDEDILPLSVWKHPSFKEPPAVMKPHFIANFFNKFEAAAVAKNGQLVIGEKEWKQLQMQLEVASLKRERDNFEVYSTFYEGLLSHLYLSHYHNERELKHYKSLASDKLLNSTEEAKVLLAGQTRELTLEITALRNRISQLEEEVEHSHLEVASQVKRRYQELLRNMFSTSSSIKNRFEDYRKTLYDDTLEALQEVRQQSATSIQRMRQRLSLDEAGRTETVFLTKLKGKEIHEIQQENSSLAKNMYRMRAFNKWKEEQLQSECRQQVHELEGQLEELKVNLSELKESAKEERKLLKLQIAALQKVFFKSEKDIEIYKRKVEEEKQKRIALSRANTKTQSSSLVNSNRDESSKVEHLTAQLEKKDAEIKALTELLVKQNNTLQLKHTQINKVMKDLKKQLSRERLLKLDAFHQFEDLLVKVHDQDVESSDNASKIASLKVHSSSVVMNRPKASVAALKASLKTHSSQAGLNN